MNNLIIFILLISWGFIGNLINYWCEYIEAYPYDYVRYYRYHPVHSFKKSMLIIVFWPAVFIVYIWAYYIAKWFNDSVKPDWRIDKNA